MYNRIAPFSTPLGIRDIYAYLQFVLFHANYQKLLRRSVWSHPARLVVIHKLQFISVITRDKFGETVVSGYW